MAVAIAIGFAAVPYAVAIGSPLRLSPDSLTYLAVADRIPLAPTAQIYPPGYPALLRGAEHIGLGNAWGFVVVNLLLLAVGVIAVFFLCRRALDLSPTVAALVCLAVLLARPFTDLTPTLLSDVPSFGGAMVSLAALTTAERRAGRGRLAWLVAGAALAAATISIRVQGIALVPAVVAVAVGRARWAAVGRLARRHRTVAASIAVASVLVLGGLAVLVLETTSYAQDITTVWRDIHGVGDLLDRVRVEAAAKLDSVGELGTQGYCCGGRVPMVFSELAGIMLIALVALGMWCRGRFGAIEVFVLSTAAIVVLYAGGIPRFWVGALPFLIVYVGLAAQRLTRLRVARIAFGLFATGYAIAGLAAGVHSIRLSTAGRGFPDAWASQVVSAPMIAAYRISFGEIPPTRRPIVNLIALRELRR